MFSEHLLQSFNKRFSYFVTKAVFNSHFVFLHPIFCNVVKILVNAFNQFFNTLCICCISLFCQFNFNSFHFRNYAGRYYSFKNFSRFSFKFFCKIFIISKKCS